MDRYRGVVAVTRRVEVEFECDLCDSPGQLAIKTAMQTLEGGAASVDVEYTFSTSLQRVESA